MEALIDNNIDMQEFMIDLNESTMQELVKQIITSDLINSDEGIAFVVRLLLLGLQVRPRNEYLYFQLVKNLLAEASDDVNCLSHIRTHLFNELIRPFTFHCYFDLDSMNLHFLYICHKSQIFSDLEITKFVKETEKRMESTTKSFYWVFTYFAPVIQRKSQKMYDRCLKKFESACKSQDLPPQLIEYYEKFEELKENDWKKLYRILDHDKYEDPLRECLRNDDIEMLRDLAARPDFDVNAVIPTSLFEPINFLQHLPTIAQYSAFNSSVECFKFLLMNSVEVDKLDQINENIMYYAISGGNMEIIRLLQQKNCLFDDVMHSAVRSFHFELLLWINETMIKDIKSVDRNGSTIFHIAAQVNNLKVAQYCISNGFDINERNEDSDTPLHISAVNNSCEVAYLLLKQPNIDVNAKLTRMARFSDTDGTPLHSAALRNNIYIMELLLKHPSADPNITDFYGDTPLHLSAEENCFECSKSLLDDSRIIADVQNQDGWTPFHLAVRTGNNDLVNIFLAHGRFDINSRIKVIFHFIIFKKKKNKIKKTNNLETPLHWAAISGKPKTIQLLMKVEGIEKNCIDNQGMTPLHFAVLTKKIESLNCFLDDPIINPNIQSNLGVCF